MRWDLGKWRAAGEEGRRCKVMERWWNPHALDDVAWGRGARPGRGHVTGEGGRTNRSTVSERIRFLMAC